MFKVNNKNVAVSIVNFERISFLFSGDSIFDSEEVFVSWGSPRIFL